jgi:hypothetical protein
MIKSLDINYGFNGEVSTASLIRSDSTIACSATAEGSVEFNIQQLLKDYALYKTTKTNSAGFKEISEEWVDKQAQRLEAIPVLVRGITASPFAEPFSYQGRLYNFAEVDKKIVDIGEQSKTEPELRDDSILILGKTISVLSTSYKNDNYFDFYSKGNLIGSTPLRSKWPQEAKDAMSNLEIDASLKFGYTLEDLKKGIEICGYTVEDYPDSSLGGDFSLIETGGSLKDCISAVASMYGVYWSCRGNKISFYTRSEIETINNNIEDLTDSSDETIISSSYSTDIYNKSKISVINGSASETFSGGGSNFQIGAVNRSLTFKYIDIRFYLKNKELIPIGPFYSSIIFSQNENLFDYIFLMFIFNKKEEARKYKAIDKYIDDNDIELQKQPFAWKNNASPIKKILSEIAPLDQTFYDMRKKGKDEVIDLPSHSKIYSATKSVCDFLGNTYISRPVSKRQSQYYEITPKESLSVSRAYPSSTKVTEVDELNSFIVALKSLIEEDISDELSNYSLYDLAAKIHLEKDQTFTISKNNSFIYIAKKQFIETSNSPEKNEDAPPEANVLQAAKDAIDNLVKEQKGVPNFPLEADSIKLLPCSDARNGFVSNIAATSTALVEKILKIADSPIVMKCIKVREPETSESDDGDEEKRIKELLGSNEIKSFTVVPNLGGELSPVEIATFDCNLDEENFTRLNLPSLNPASYVQRSSTVTYFGFKEPDEEDPSLSNYTLNFSDSSTTTSITRSTKEILGIDKGIVMGSYMSSNNKNSTKFLRARQKNALRIN